MSTKHYDLIIIGTGAGDGTLAYRMAQSDKKILILEHGKSGEDPTEPFRSEDFFYPAVSHEPRIQEVSDTLP